MELPYINKELADLIARQESEFRRRPIFDIVFKLNLQLPKHGFSNTNRFAMSIIFAIGYIIDYAMKREHSDKYSMGQLRKELNELAPELIKPMKNIFLSELENDTVEYAKKYLL